MTATWAFDIIRVRANFDKYKQTADKHVNKGWKHMLILALITLYVKCFVLKTCVVEGGSLFEPQNSTYQKMKF